VRRWGTDVARRVPSLIGSTKSFVGLVAVTLAWLVSGFWFDFSDQWLLVPSAVASIVALILVVLLQYSQNRDTRAIQLKLDELIRAVDEGREHFVRLERLPDKALEVIESEFDRLQEGRAGGIENTASSSARTASGSSRGRQTHSS
jgi:low affinity Fe/Cu permease